MRHFSPNFFHGQNVEYVFAAYSPEGRRLGRFQAYEGALGIKMVRWSPSGQFVAIGSYDQKARIINHLTWRPVEEYSHPSVLPPAAAVVYAEIDLSGAISHALAGDYSPHAVANSAYQLVAVSFRPRSFSGAHPLWRLHPRILQRSPYFCFLRSLSRLVPPLASLYPCCRQDVYPCWRRLPLMLRPVHACLLPVACRMGMASPSQRSSAILKRQTPRWESAS